MYFKYVYYYFSNWHNSFLRTHLNYTVHDGLKIWDHRNSQHQVLPWRWCQLSTWSDDLVRDFKAVTLNRSECWEFWWVFRCSVFCLHIHSHNAHLHLKGGKKFSFICFSWNFQKAKISVCPWGSTVFNFKILNYTRTSKGWKRKGNVLSDLCSKNAPANLIFSCWFLKEPFHQEGGGTSRRWAH